MLKPITANSWWLNSISFQSEEAQYRALKIKVNIIASHRGKKMGSINANRRDALFYKVIIQSPRVETERLKAEAE